MTINANDSSIPLYPTIPTYIQKPVSDRLLTSYAKEFLSFLADSQNMENLSKLSEISHQLTIFMVIGHASSQNILSPQEENELIEMLSSLKNQHQYSGLDLDHLQAEISTILEKKLNSRCSVIKTVMQIEYMLCITPPGARTPIDSKEVESFIDPIIDHLPKLNNLQIKHLNHQLEDVAEMAANEPEDAHHIVENLRQIINYFHL